MKTIFKDYKPDDLVMLDRQAYYEESSTYWKEAVKALWKQKKPSSMMKIQCSYLESFMKH